jgi:type IX secretion system PorP/SprF family membrane protein
MMKDDYVVQGIYRNQWNSFTNSFKTGAFHTAFKWKVGEGKDFITTGLQAFYDQSGTIALTTNSLLPSLSYHKSLSDYKLRLLSFGVMGGWERKSFDYSKMTTNSQFNGIGFDASLPTAEPITNPNLSSWDANAGISYQSSFGEKDYNQFFVGAAYHHLNRPIASFYNDPNFQTLPSQVFTGGIQVGVDDYSYFVLQSDLIFKGKSQELAGGFLYSYNLGDDPTYPLYVLSVGSYVRWKDAVIPVVKIQGEGLGISLSYDVNASPLKAASQSRGGFELSISFSGILQR